MKGYIDIALINKSHLRKEENVKITNFYFYANNRTEIKKLC